MMSSNLKKDRGATVSILHYIRPSPSLLLLLLWSDLDSGIFWWLDTIVAVLSHTCGDSGDQIPPFS
jgi:hypothetical protein